mmetsp:Transcript_15400/g.18716  ORF Transcript_15400/g.18716 Transcript_15400/m.18716 type:complete len:335 (-) Transcript_15400:87-1091(-)
MNSPTNGTAFAGKNQSDQHRIKEFDTNGDRDIIDDGTYNNDNDALHAQPEISLQQAQINKNSNQEKGCLAMSNDEICQNTFCRGRSDEDDQVRNYNCFSNDGNDPREEQQHHTRIGDGEPERNNSSSSDPMSPLSQYFQQMGDMQKQALEKLYSTTVDGKICQAITQCEHQVETSFTDLNCSQMFPFVQMPDSNPNYNASEHIRKDCEYCMSTTGKCEIGCDRPKYFFRKKKSPFASDHENWDSKNGYFIADDASLINSNSSMCDDNNNVDQLDFGTIAGWKSQLPPMPPMPPISFPLPGAELIRQSQDHPQESFNISNITRIRKDSWMNGVFN